MSIQTNQYFDINTETNGFYYHHEHGRYAAPTQGAKRKFFQSAMRWDDNVEHILVAKRTPPALNLATLMERGGRPEGEDSWDDMAVDS